MRRWAASWLLVWVLGPAVQLRAQEVAFIHVKGPIGPATADYISRAIDVAADQKLPCLIIQLDTPGGLLDSTKEIVQTFFASPVTTVVYVAPPGATATSAGVFITLAADVAAMAPSTTIGSAHPVTIGGGGEQGTNDVMRQKLENYASSFVETIAARRKRNVEWAKAAVRESAALTAQQAKETNVVEIIAKDLPALLKQLDGWEVNGKKLQTASARVREIPMNAREKLFQIFWRPEVMFILMLIAIYGIVGELSNPGAIFPGVVGAIALILVLYMSAVLPVNIAGIALILLAIGLFVAEIFTTSFGLLTAGGIAAFVFGALMLFDRVPASFRLSWTFVLPGALLTAAFFLFIVGAGLRAQRLPRRTGKAALIGMTAKALTPISAEEGKVFVEGALWSARSEVPIAQGEGVEIVGMEGLTFKVKPKAKAPNGKG